MPTIKHGQTTHRGKSPTYGTWDHMMRRCYDRAHHKYRLYGARGIKVCERWHELKNFISDMGERPNGKTLDRYPNRNGNYEPGNCRWATAGEQRRNSSVTRFITFRGETLCMADWAQRFNMPLTTLHSRLVRSKWPLEEALTLKVNK